MSSGPLTVLFTQNKRRECAKIEDLENKSFEEIFSTLSQRKGKGGWSLLAIYLSYLQR